MEGKIVAQGGGWDNQTRQHQGSGADNQSQRFLNKRLAQKVQSRRRDRFNHIGRRHITHMLAGACTKETWKDLKITPDPNKYYDFHKKLGHAM